MYMVAILPNHKMAIYVGSHVYNSLKLLHLLHSCYINVIYIIYRVDLVDAIHEVMLHIPMQHT